MVVSEDFINSIDVTPGVKLNSIFLDESSQEFLINYSEQESVRNQIGSTQSLSRRIEIAAVRYIIDSKFKKPVSLRYHLSGAPYVEGSEVCISISHTKGAVGVVFSDKEIGLDIEKISDRVLRIQSKFLSEQDLSGIDPMDEVSHSMVYWTIKEALVKLSTNRRLDFKKDIEIEFFKLKKEGIVKAKYSFNKKGKECDIHYFIQNGFVFTIAEHAFH